MAQTRSQTKEKQFRRRGEGVMKKADAVHTLVPDIKAAVLFLDGTHLWTYESEDGWVFSIPSMTNLRLERMNPTHFRTVFEHQQALTRSVEAAMTEADPPPLPIPPLTPETTSFSSPTNETSPSSPSTLAMTRQLLSVIHSDAPSPIAQRSTRAKTAANKRHVGDIYGFLDDGSVNEI